MKVGNNQGQGHQGKPEIPYPCPWEYKLIGTDKNQVVTEVDACIGREKAYHLTDSNTSSGGRFMSWKLEVIVESEADRLKLYEQLAALAAVRIVL